MLLFSIAAYAFTIRLDAPFMFNHDDNSALFSSFASSHIVQGLAATFGQDFYTLRPSRQMIPYMHHPPAVALYLAAWFKACGRDTPAVVRVAMATLSLGSLAFFFTLASAFFKTRPARFFASMAFALSPMFLFMGRMANHQTPGLFFFVLLAAGAMHLRQGASRTAICAVAAGCAGVLTASWHATIAAVVFTLLFPSAINDAQTRRRFRLTAWCSFSVGAILFAIPFVLARNGTGYGENASEIAQWFSFGGATAWKMLDNYLSSFGHGMREYAVAPWIVFLGAFSLALWRRLTVRSANDRVAAFFALAAGNAVYALMFSNAMRHHAYQLFYFLPALALATGLASEKLLAARTISPFRKVAAFALFLSVFTFYSHQRLNALYSGPASYARQVVPTLINKYL